MNKDISIEFNPPALRYIAGYPAHIQQQVLRLYQQGALTAYLEKKYPAKHQVQSDKSLYDYVSRLKQRFLKNAAAIDKVCFDQTLGLTHHALGLHTAISRVHGGKLKAKKEIRVASLFKQAAPEFLEMIVVHELAHLKEKDHNKAFYQLCEHMLPDYHQIEFDLRLFLIDSDASS
ncbi:M48 family metallopeptidase [Leeia sp. TBRC 13508]|uniref:M48 family metallopeptidase n=1 Tax=Leeia speluncae TaxID=2884804 RepID=A0ABS8D2U2_9NEIS|nr:M48 family metallopeptidase [Leeia speluncae]MCB6182507.1 M48 family metallopeptidase [Leeia speluncae]